MSEDEKGNEDVTPAEGTEVQDDAGESSGEDAESESQLTASDE